MSARSELDRLCDESWTRLGQDLKATSRSMGRIGLSCARRHPALLLGGGALLAFGATMWLTRNKRHAPSARHHDHDHDHARDGAHERHADEGDDRTAQDKHGKHSLTRAFAAAALTKILKNAVRMWLLQQMSSHLGNDEEPDASQAEARAESVA